VNDLRLQIKLNSRHGDPLAAGGGIQNLGIL